MKLNEYLLLEMSSAEAVQILRRFDKDFPKSPSKEQIKNARRSFAKKYHPDKGYDGDELKKINAALDAIGKDSGGDSAEREWNQPGPQNEADQDWADDPKFRGVPIWAWAGYSGGASPSINYRRDPSNYSFLKREAWRVSGEPTKVGKKDELTFTLFDGHHGRNMITVVGKKSKINRIIPLFLDWVDKFFTKGAVVIQGEQIGGGKKTLVVPLKKNGKPILKRDWKTVEHDSFNNNPFNDKDYTNEIKQYMVNK